LKHKKVVIAGVALFVLVMLGGGLFMNKNSGDWSERHREDIEENVRSFLESHHLNPDDVEIEQITGPIRFPTGEEEFSVYIKHWGTPYFYMVLKGNPDSLTVNQSSERMIRQIFNELYLQARYEEFKPAIEYLHSLGIEDPLRPQDATNQYMHTNVGLDNEIQDEVIQTFRESKDEFDKLVEYIDGNLDRIIKLETIDIRGEKEEIDSQKAEEIEETLKELLPKGDYRVEIGVKDFETRELEGFRTDIIIR
jgi:hypothetical protein